MAIVEKKLDEQGMLREDILRNNLFKDCTARELHTLWLGLKRFYKEGVFTEDNPLTSYKNKYCASNSQNPILQVEQDLLCAIACEAFG